MKKILIGEHELSRIQEFALIEFGNTRSFSSLSGKEMQIFLILKGLHHLFESKGVEPPFEIEVKGVK